MKIKKLLLFVSCVLFISCSGTKKYSEQEMQEELREISKKYEKFTIRDYVNNSVAIYGCSFNPLKTGGITRLEIRTLYDKLHGKYDSTVLKEMRKQSGTVYLPEKGRNQMVYGKVYCFQEEKWPGSDLHIPYSFVIYDNLLHQGNLSCTPKDFEKMIMNKQD